MSTNLESVPTINNPSEIVINQIGMFTDKFPNAEIIFQHHENPPLVVKPGDILEPVIDGYKVYTMDGRSVKEPIFHYKIKENKDG